MPEARADRMLSDIQQRTNKKSLLQFDTHMTHMMMMMMIFCNLV
jgi:hypothetical protein